MSTNPEDFFGSGIPSFKFEEPGARVAGRIVDQEVRQQTDFRTGELKVWPSGDPMNQLVITLATDLRDPDIDGDDGHRRIYVKGKNLTDGFRAALRAAKAKRLEPGGTITVTYTGNGKPSNPGISPPKEYAVTYTPPTTDATSDFLGIDKPADTWGPPAQAPQAAPTAPVAPAATAPDPTTTARSLLALNVPRDQVAAATGLSPEIVAAIANVA